MSIPEFGTKQDGVDYIDRPGVYAVIENNDRQIAVIKTSNGYFLPGGGIDIGESDIEALRREVVEETGYQISILREIGAAVEYIDVEGEEKHYQYAADFTEYNFAQKLETASKKIIDLIGYCQKMS